MDPYRIEKALAAHGLWRYKLERAAVAGELDTPLEVVGAADQCELGQLLAKLDGQEDPHVPYVRRLHGEFHRVTALAAEFAISGCPDEVGLMMGPGGEFDHIWTVFAAALRNWERAVGRPNFLTRRVAVVKA